MSRVHFENGYFKGSGKITKELQKYSKLVRVLHITNEQDTVFDETIFIPDLVDENNKSEENILFPNLRHLIIENETFKPFDLLWSCSKTLRTLVISYIPSTLYFEFPCLWKIEGLKKPLDSVLVKFPMLHFCTGIDTKNYRPAVLMPSDDIENEEGDSNAYICLTNQYKTNALITFLLCMKKIGLRDLIPLLREFAKAISRKHWKILLLKTEGIILSPDEFYYIRRLKNQISIDQYEFHNSFGFEFNVPSAAENLLKTFIKRLKE